MDQPTLPKYQPKQWLVFKVGTAHFFGKVVGGSLQHTGWLYNVDIGQSAVQAVQERDVLALATPEGRWSTIGGAIEGSSNISAATL